MLKPLPESEPVDQTKNETNMVQMKSLKKELKFITDGNGSNNSSMKQKQLIASEPIKRHFDFDELIWKSRGYRIPEESWFQIESFYLNYPVLNDRIAYVRGKVSMASLTCLDPNF